jgi:PAS domain S-box-containing protein
MAMNNPVLILYLEDNPRDAELVRDKLQQLTMPCELRIATGRAQYEAALAQTRFDLILSDYAMPDYDGFAALSLALDKQPDVPFILISGMLSEEQAVDCLHRGATDYVIKQNLKRLAPAVLRALTEAKVHQKRREAEDALRALSSRHEAILAATPDIIMEVDCSKVYTWANPAGIEFFGEDVIGKEAAFYFEDAEPVYRIVQPLFDGDERVIYVESLQRRKDGEKRWLAWHCRILKDSQGNVTGALSTAHDITARKQAEAAQAQMQAQLIQSQKLESIGTLAAGVAHEINNPIMGIMGYAQLIQDKLGPDSPIADYAAEIGKEADRVILIVKNLLSFARIDSQISSPAHLHDIVKTTLSLIRAVLRHDEVMLEVDVPPDLPKILCHSQKIRQVIMNLLTNARDALNQKYPGPDENKKVIISAQELVLGEQSSVRLTVEDHGPGIPEELRERIFNPFFSTKARHKGTGLGLSISHGIVKDHGGTLSVESEVGQWTRFHVDLPVESGEP